MKKKNVLYVCLYLLITLIFFGLLWKIEFATDTYAVFNFNSEEIYLQFASSGRFITAIFGKIVKILSIQNNVIYSISYILAIVSATWSQYKLFNIIKKDVNNKILQILIPTLIIINPFSIELFLFIEKGIMLFGILMSIYAVEYLIKFFESNKKKNLFFASIFMLFANFSYQGVVGIFVAISIVFILKYSKTFKYFIINNLLTLFVYGIPAIIDYSIVKILYRSSRVNGEFVFLESLKNILNGTYNMWITTFGILPKYVFACIIGLIFILLCVDLIINRKANLNTSIKLKLVEVLKFVYITLGVTLISILPQFLQSTSSIWLVARSTYPFASLYGVLLLLFILEKSQERNVEFVANCNYDVNEKKRNMEIGENTIFIIASFLLLILQAKSFFMIEQDRFKLNLEDEEISKQIIEQVEKYEKETGIEIKNIVIYEDSELKYTYDGTFATGDMNIKAYFAEWSTKEIIEYYLNRDLTKIDKDEDIEKSFLQNNWDEFNLEQIKFEDDILIICRY